MFNNKLIAGTALKFQFIFALHLNRRETPSACAGKFMCSFPLPNFLAFLLGLPEIFHWEV